MTVEYRTCTGCGRRVFWEAFLDAWMHEGAEEEPHDHVGAPAGWAHNGEHWTMRDGRVDPTVPLIPARVNALVGACPFCGACRVSFVRCAPPEVWRVRCSECGGEGPEGRTLPWDPFESAALAWRNGARNGRVYSADFRVDRARGFAWQLDPRKGRR